MMVEWTCRQAGCGQITKNHCDFFGGFRIRSYVEVEDDFSDDGEEGSRLHHFTLRLYFNKLVIF
jgi:hypothetical protein